MIYQTFIVLDVLICCCCLVAKLCLTLPDPMDCSRWQAGSSVHGIILARVLEWVAISFSRGSSEPRDRTVSPAWQVDSLPPNQQGSLEVRITSVIWVFSSSGIHVNQVPAPVESTVCILRGKWASLSLEQMGKPRHRAFRQIAWTCTVWRLQSWDSHPARTSEHKLLISPLCSGWSWDANTRRCHEGTLVCLPILSSGKAGLTPCLSTFLLLLPGPLLGK